jgi:hypothetical protein
MKKAPEIFQSISPTLAGEILSYLQETDKPAYRMAIQTLATQRKLRPVFVERKPRNERHVWMQAALARPSSEPIAANILQMWLMGTQSALLCDFLDSLGIEHDEKGGIDALPESPTAEKLQTAIDTVVAKYPPDVVSIYLNSFQSMDIAGWPVLEEALQKDARLQFKPDVMDAAEPASKTA